MSLVDRRSVLHVVRHALQEGQAEVMHAQVAPPVLQLACACTLLWLVQTRARLSGLLNKSILPGTRGKVVCS